MTESHPSPAGSRGFFRCELPCLGLLVTIITAFLAPLLLRWSPAIYDDAAVETLPALIRVARSVQSGCLPLWDTLTFAGAKPIYVDNGWLIFYPPMYPFFLLADPDSMSNSHLTLMLLPYALHLAWAGMGGYLFARLVLALHPVAAMLVGLIYSLSPEMGYQLSMTPAAITLSHLPWCALAIARYLATGSTGWWIAGVLLTGLLNCTGNPNYLIRVDFVLAVTVMAIWISMILEYRLGRRHGHSPTDEKIAPPVGDSETRDSAGATFEPDLTNWLAHARRLAGGLTMLALGIGLAGFAWGGTLEAAAWIRQSLPQALSLEVTTSAASHSSMHPLNLVTLFLPDYFGASDGPRFWGAGFLLTKHVTLSGGLLVMVAALGGAATWLFRSADNAQQVALRRWTWIATLLLVAALLTMLGRHTPFFQIASTIFPWFFEFPHPVYYRFASCWSLAILVGIGVTTALELEGIHRRWQCVALACVSIALIGGTVGLAAGFDGDWTSMSGWQSLGIRNLWNWFVWRSVVYPLVPIIGLIAVCCGAGARVFGWSLAAAIAAETFYIAWSAFYTTTYLGPQQDITDPAGHERYLRPEDDPRWRELLPLARQRLDNRDYRFVTDHSVLDNVAWLINTRAMLGYAAKPLMPEFAKLIDEVAAHGNFIQLDDPPEQLLRNLNVRYHVSQRSETPDVIRPETGSTRPRISIAEVSSPLPYLYTQDRIVDATEDAQLDKLLNADLRGAVYVDAAAYPQAAWSYTAADRFENAAPRQTFQRLQQQNVIQSISPDSANRIAFQVDVAEPAMVVINECWHPGWTASIGGKPAEVYRVNHLQQGLWLEPGQHRIEMRFLPASVKYGCAVSGVSLLCLLAIGFFRARRGRPGKRA